MARSLSNVKTLSTFVVDQISTVVARRGNSVASQAVSSTGAKVAGPKVMMKKGTEKTVETAWVPDPVTGYYRPESQVKEVDPVDLRKTLIRSKSRAK